MQVCVLLMLGTAICYVVILVLDILTNRTSALPESPTLGDQMTNSLPPLQMSASLTLDVTPQNREKFAALSNAVRTEKLKDMFRFHYNKLVGNKLKDHSSKLPTEYEIALLLSNLYSDWNEGVNFIQVGACDGEFVASNDPIQKLLTKSNHWNGVMMEPVPFLFEKLETAVHKHVPNWQERVHLMNAALSDHNGPQPFYIVNEKFALEKPDETHALKYQIGSFDKNHIVKHLIKLHRRGELKEEVDAYIKTIYVEGKTPDKVVEDFETSGKMHRDAKVDLLLIDAEGYDLMVLKSFMAISHIRPLIIYYENLHLKEPEKEEAEKLLQSYGYITWPAGWNTMAVRVCDL